MQPALGCDGGVGHRYLYLCKLAELAQEGFGLGLFTFHTKSVEEVESLAGMRYCCRGLFLSLINNAQAVMGSRNRISTTACAC